MDTCSLIHLCENIKCKDLLRICERYHFVTTSNIRDEFNKKGNLDLRIDVHHLSDAERKLSMSMSLSEGIDIGESTAIVHAFSINESVPADVFFVTEDEKALRTFNDWVQEDYIHKQFSKVAKIRGISIADMIKRQYDKDLLSESDMIGFQCDLCDRLSRKNLEKLKVQ